MNRNELTIRIEKGEAGLFYLTSPDVPGLLLASPSFAGVLEELPRALEVFEEIKAAYAENMVYPPVVETPDLKIVDGKAEDAT